MPGAVRCFDMFGHILIQFSQPVIRDHEESLHMLKSTLEEQIEQNDKLEMELAGKRAECEERCEDLTQVFRSSWSLWSKLSTVNCCLSNSCLGQESSIENQSLRGSKQEL